MTAHAANAAALASPGPVTPNGAAAAAAQRPAPSARIPWITVDFQLPVLLEAAAGPEICAAKMTGRAVLGDDVRTPGSCALLAVLVYDLPSGDFVPLKRGRRYDEIGAHLWERYRKAWVAKWTAHVTSLAAPATVGGAS